MKNQRHSTLCFFAIFVVVAGRHELPTLVGIRVENKAALPSKDKLIARLEVDVGTKIRFVGKNLTLVEAVMFTRNKTDCPRSTPTSSTVKRESFLNQTLDSILFEYTFAHRHVGYLVHVCLLVDNGTDFWSHQGVGHVRSVRVNDRVIAFPPMPLKIVFVILLLCFSALFSGLNIGLMALDLTELHVLLSSGTAREKKFAKQIIPVRSKGNYLLCTILLGIAIVNTGVSLLMNDIEEGFIALIVSSFLIVVFGEIVPQSICTRYGLAVGAYTIVLTKLFMFLTAPLSWPASKILDFIFGSDIGRVYSKERLLGLIDLSKETQKDLQTCQEVAIVSGALQLAQKTASSVMTPKRDVFMVSKSVVLDTRTISHLINSGFTRIPVYEKTSDNITHVLNVKDLALIDPDDNVLLRDFCRIYENRTVPFVSPDKPLASILEDFKKGDSHIAFVVTNPQAEPGNRELLGLVTLEDIIEEVIQQEIIDESDLAKSTHGPKSRDLHALILELGGIEKNIPAQLLLTAYQFLTTTFVEEFKPEVISTQVLYRLIKHAVVKLEPFAKPLTVRRLSLQVLDGANGDSESGFNYLYKKGKTSDKFTLVLEGRVEVTAGQDNFVFQVGPFHSFGQSIIKTSHEKMLDLKEHSEKCRQVVSFMPEFSAKVVENFICLQISSLEYQNAYFATKIASEQMRSGPSNAKMKPVRSVSPLQLELPTIVENGVDTHSTSS